MLKSPLIDRVLILFMKSAACGLILRELLRR